ncbi:hypothetical protein L6R52_14895 [Myxococcota bacterium]|nr:hypothetical protein [Myxococcota bacterium]
MAKSLVAKSDINSDGAIRAGDVSKISAESKTKAMDAYVGLLDQLRRTAAKDGGPTTANVQKAVDTAVKKLKQRDKDGSGALEDAEQVRSMTALETRMVQFASSAKGKKVSNFALPEPYVVRPPRFRWTGTVSEVATSLLNAYSKPANDNFFPVRVEPGQPRASRFVVNGAEARTMVTALKKLYLSRQKSVLRELASRTLSSAYGCVSPTDSGKKIFLDYAKDLGLDLDFQQPAAPQYHVSHGRLLRVSSTEALFPGVIALGLAERDDLETRHMEQYWIESARAEKASIPAFLRMARELQRVGAPSALRRAALDAAEDEARHTEICLDRAHATSGRAWSVEELSSPPRIVDLATLAEEAWLDGCLGEGQAAEALVWSASQARDSDVRAAISSVAGDERRHAELAWAVLEWTLREGGSPLRDQLAETMWRAESAPAEARASASSDESRLDQDKLLQSGVAPDALLSEAGLRVMEDSRTRLVDLLDRTTNL